MAGKFYEPQTPLMQGGDFYYPPTTAGQVILPDGRRLGSAEGLNITADDVNALTVDMTNGIQGEAAGINADTLGGIAAANYLLKTETAADSENLGGIAASDYVRKTDTIANAENSNMFNGLTYKQIMELEHGVGSFYFTMSALDDPNSKWDWMTWELVTDRFLLGAGSTYEVGSEGGEAEHTLTVDEIPSHTHYVNGSATGGGQLNYAHFNATTTSGDATTWGLRSVATGGGAAHNNMPPYLSIFMWTRTA